MARVLARAVEGKSTSAVVAEQKSSLNSGAAVRRSMRSCVNATHAVRAWAATVWGLEYQSPLGEGPSRSNSAAVRHRSSPAARTAWTIGEPA